MEATRGDAREAGGPRHAGPAAPVRPLAALTVNAGAARRPRRRESRSGRVSRGAGRPASGSPRGGRQVWALRQWAPRARGQGGCEVGERAGQTNLAGTWNFPETEGEPARVISVKAAFFPRPAHNPPCCKNTRSSPHLICNTTSARDEKACSKMEKVKIHTVKLWPFGILHNISYTSMLILRDRSFSKAVLFPWARKGSGCLMRIRDSSMKAVFPDITYRTTDGSYEELLRQPGRRLLMLHHVNCEIIRNKHNILASGI
ncbi:uncharacterized protein [Oryctolagus cuniculus]|uniref:uncharacterized protein n=1 Tax=Oryctolagus cuniculus TaxID=9986 RepID=UPI003879E79E